MNIDSGTPLITVFIDYFPLEKREMLPLLIEGFLTLPLQLAIIEPAKDLLKNAVKLPKNGNAIFISEKSMERLFEASDMALFLMETYHSFVPIKSALRSKVVPIMQGFSELKNLTNYNPVTEKGNSFLFDHFTAWNIFAEVVRACENYRFPYDWKNIIEQGKE
ncbi:hypothetical protein HYV57_05535 [Candidatus Peregrinibacteria bacterium]|nr:hypothetical protein [Candidatus Peregrinibacteria bacterium]